MYDHQCLSLQSASKLTKKSYCYTGIILDKVIVKSGIKNDTDLFL